jgi:hypothetical protein
VGDKGQPFAPQVLAPNSRFEPNGTIFGLNSCENRSRVEGKAYPPARCANLAAAEHLFRSDKGLAIKNLQETEHFCRWRQEKVAKSVPYALPRYDEGR